MKTVEPKRTNRPAWMIRMAFSIVNLLPSDIRKAREVLSMSW
jgi:hypothetical protein